jgi:hypothetical protein
MMRYDAHADPKGLHDVDRASPISDALPLATIKGAVPRMIGYAWLMSPLR